jgi:hypothetical protein
LDGKNCEKVASLGFEPKQNGRPLIDRKKVDKSRKKKQ